MMRSGDKSSKSYIYIYIYIYTYINIYSFIQRESEGDDVGREMRDGGRSAKMQGERQNGI